MEGKSKYYLAMILRYLAIILFTAGNNIILFIARPANVPTYCTYRIRNERVNL